jgi:hypothetical protein
MSGGVTGGTWDDCVQGIVTHSLNAACSATKLALADRPLTNAQTRRLDDDAVRDALQLVKGVALRATAGDDDPVTLASVKARLALVALRAALRSGEVRP